MLQGVKVTINSFGFRGPEVEKDKNPETVRVLVMGDSVVFGQGVYEEFTLSAQLQNKLSNKMPETGWEVINAGVRGYNIKDYRAIIRPRIMAVEPDVLVLVITEINDPEREAFTPRSEKLEIWNKSLWMKIPLMRRLRANDFAQEINPRLPVVARVHTIRELDFLKGRGASGLVQPEYEASIELTRHVLSQMGRGEEEVTDLIARLRKTCPPGPTTPN